MATSVLSGWEDYSFGPRQESQIWPGEIRTQDSQQAQSIEDHEQWNSHVSGDGAPERGVAGEGQKDEQHLDADGGEDVLADDREGSTCVPDQARQLLQVVRHEGHVGFDGDAK